MTSRTIFALRTLGVALLCGSLTALPARAEASRSSAVLSGVVGSKSPLKAAAPRKANGSGIEVQFRLDATPRIGQAVPITLGFVGVVPQAGATLRLEADAGLTLPEQYKAPAALADDGAASTIVTVTPTAEGLFYLHVFTTQHGVTSVSSIPVQIGTPALAKQRNDLQSTPGGDMLTTMPVK